jgi:hypothetical protein
MSHTSLAVAGGSGARSNALAHFAPTNFTELQSFAEYASRSGLVPKDYVGKPSNIVIAVMKGAEIGFTPMQALDAYAIINGRATMWGDALVALVRGNSICEYIRETIDGTGDQRTATCRAKRRGEDEEIVRTFSVAQARAARLWGKQGPWTEYSDRMLQMRARGFTLRDAFADVLRGTAMAEEVADYPSEEPDATTTAIAAAPTRTEGVKGALAQRVAAAQPVEPTKPEADEAVIADVQPAEEPAVPASDDDIPVDAEPSAQTLLDPATMFPTEGKKGQQLADEAAEAAQSRGIAPTDFRALCANHGGLNRATFSVIMAEIMALPSVEGASS